MSVSSLDWRLDFLKRHALYPNHPKFINAFNFFNYLNNFCFWHIFSAEAAYSESIFQSCSVPTIANAIITQVPSHPSEKPYSEINLSDHQQKLPHGSIIRIRCIQVGVYKLTGVHEVTCVDGLWSSALPVCTMTTLHSNFSGKWMLFNYSN